MKINYVRKQSGKRTTIILPDSICELWFTTRPPVSESCARQALCELLEQLDDPKAGTTFQSQAELVILGDIRAYQNRLLASNDELKCRVIDWITSTLTSITPPTAQASEILEELEKLKLVPWEVIEKFDSLEEQRWK
ncbi:TPA: hypothetical protein N5O03_003911 [Enterobacter hormaechei subsp. xiangfangensis]|uniref:hypothetical protein n=1 Tax=Enterobacter hormaechei TaxID=158836 RepID=UPI0013E99290|nr:hypothetical protein [Enterobacter hormaechei]HCM9369760.1 hypothetical protein [Enterobacter hormaechei subsp. xiangfangensis]KAF6533491.1 hypothetical protein G9G00_16560 [Enterobacter hormaechei]KAF6533799.1 hypothetical protein G9G11_16965 [Enterobacter hormaechei]HCM9387825.1 hypothetical protein [Enterobacter hormaechei subsp. xiangfangensis]HCM9697834.1 hypothetical protein [Enterobacter hormaechei subsp. xiangfangensis]